jgi:hypothetical protein
MILDLGMSSADDPAEAQVQRALAWETPQLAELSPGTVRRWKGAPAWVPPETHLLCRHRALDRPHYVVTARDRRSPRGYAIEFDLGVVHNFALPGTRRLVDEGEGFSLTDDQNDLEGERRSLGYVEQAPLPMLDVLELRRMPETRQHVLVAGADDPLAGVAEPLGALGYIESFPIHPRKPIVQAGTWGLVPLLRTGDGRAWRHRYSTGPANPAADAVALGGLWMRGGPGLTALRVDAGGRLGTDLLTPERTHPRPNTAARWIAAPLGWDRRPRAWAVRAAASRARHAVRHAPGAGDAPDAGSILGWLCRRPALGWSPLFSATHPVLGDQFLTRSALEAQDLGYRLDGVLGYICDAGADAGAHLQPREILWGSRFGRRRRYVEGPVPRA